MSSPWRTRAKFSGRGLGKPLLQKRFPQRFNSETGISKPPLAEPALLEVVLPPPVFQGGVYLLHQIPGRLYAKLHCNTASMARGSVQEVDVERHLQGNMGRLIALDVGLLDG